MAVPEREDSLARALGCTDSEHAQALNQAERRSGHVGQNRFFSCPLDPPHLMSAMRYTNLNPVRAGLAARPWDRPWSSARAHTVDAALEAVLDPRWVEHFGRRDRVGWKKLLLAGHAGRRMRRDSR